MSLTQTICHTATVHAPSVLISGSHSYMHTKDDDYWIVAPGSPTDIHGHGLHCEIEFEIPPAERVIGLTLVGYFTGTIPVKVSAWDYGLSDWVEISTSTTEMVDQSEDATHAFKLEPSMVSGSLDVKILLHSTSTNGVARLNVNFICITTNEINRYIQAKSMEIPTPHGWASVGFEYVEGSDRCVMEHQRLVCGLFQTFPLLINISGLQLCECGGLSPIDDGCMDLDAVSVCGCNTKFVGPWLDIFNSSFILEEASPGSGFASQEIIIPEECSIEFHGANEDEECERVQNCTALYPQIFPYDQISATVVQTWYANTTSMIEIWMEWWDDWFSMDSTPIVHWGTNCETMKQGFSHDDCGYPWYGFIGGKVTYGYGGG